MGVTLAEDINAKSRILLGVLMPEFPLTIIPGIVLAAVKNEDAEGDDETGRGSDPKSIPRLFVSG